MNGKRTLIASIAVVLAAGVLLAWRSVNNRRTPARAPEAESPAVLVTVVYPQRMTLNESLTITGTLRSKEEVTVASEVMGKVISVGADEGDKVKPGQLLVRMDDSAVRAQVNQARAQLQAALFKYEQLLAASQIQNTQTVTDIEQAQANLRAAKAKLRELEASRELTVKETELSVTQAEANLEAAKAKLRQLENAAAIEKTQADADLKQAEASVAAAKKRLQIAQANVEATDTQAESQLAQAEAEHKAAKAALEKLKAGARPQEKKQAQQVLRQAEVNLENAKANYERAKFLFKNGAIAKADLENAEKLHDLAQSNYESAKEQLSLIEEGARVEDIKIAEERLKQAEAAVKIAKAAQVQKQRARDELEIAKTQLEQAEAALEVAKRHAERKRISDEEVEAARAQVKQAETALELAKGNLKRRKMLDENVEAAKMQVEVAEVQLKLARVGKVRFKVTERELDAAAAAVEQAKASLAAAEAQLRKCTLHSPVEGYVAKRLVHVGETAAPGQVLMQLVSTESVYFEATLPESDYLKVKEGQEVRVSVDSLPGVTLTGRASKVIPVSDPMMRTFRLKISLPPLKGALQPGAFARGELVLRSVPHTLTVPEECVFSLRGESHVFVVKGGRAKRRRVETGLRTKGRIEIKKGVRDGEPVVCSGQTRLRDRQKVRATAVNEFR